MTRRALEGQGASRQRVSGALVLWFHHMLLHAGQPVTRGVEHVLRTDVLHAA